MIDLFLAMNNSTSSHVTLWFSLLILSITIPQQQMWRHRKASHTRRLLCDCATLVRRIDFLADPNQDEVFGSLVHHYFASAAAAAPKPAFFEVVTLKSIPTLIHSKNTTASLISILNFSANTSAETDSVPLVKISLISVDFSAVFKLYFSIIVSNAFLCNSYWCVWYSLLHKDLCTFHPFFWHISEQYQTRWHLEHVLLAAFSHTWHVFFVPLLVAVGDIFLLLSSECFLCL